MLANWVDEQGADVHFGEGGTFKRRRNGEVVQSRIDFAVALWECGWMVEDSDWLLLDHASMAGSLVVGDLRQVVDREVIHGDRLGGSLVNKDQRWYNKLVGRTAYEKLLDLQACHIKRLKVQQQQHIGNNHLEDINNHTFPHVTEN